MPYDKKSFLEGFVTGRMVWKPAQKAPLCLIFTSERDFSFGFPEKRWDGILEFSNDGFTWTEYTDQIRIYSSNGTLMLRGRRNTYVRLGTSNFDSNVFLATAPVMCSGNIETLLDWEIVSRNQHPIMASSCFDNLFYNFKYLISSPILPAKTLLDKCYARMFMGCHSLLFPPTLPAMTLVDGCYADMFAGCKSLIVPPTLPATSLANECYAAMFSGCESLTTAPKLPAQILVSACYEHMFSGCKSLIDPPQLPNTTTLPPLCYALMFIGCSSLAKLPYIYGTDFGNLCCYRMFENCTSISVSSSSGGIYRYSWRIPNSGTGVLGNMSIDRMFYGTGGSFTGSPQINTTYYTDNAPV